MTNASGGFVRLMPSMKIPRPEDFPAEPEAESDSETETAASDENEGGASNPGAP